MSDYVPKYGLYPLFLKLEGVLCVVVGAGTIGAQKARELVAAGAQVRCISPEFSKAWEALEGNALLSQVERVERPYRSGDVRGARLVIAATGDPQVDDVVYAEAVAEGALTNVVDIPEQCEFYAAAVVHRGPVTIAIGTSGTSPSLARILRERIDRWLPSSLGALAAALGEVRPTLLERHPDYRKRADRLYAGVSAAFDFLDAGGDALAIGPEVARMAACDDSCSAAKACCSFAKNEGVKSC